MSGSKGAAGRWTPSKAQTLRRAEKSAGSTKWALEGAGAKRNPPGKERAKALRAKLKREQALVRELRAERDAAKKAAAAETEEAETKAAA